VTNAGRRVRSAEISVFGTKRQVSNVESSTNGAELKVLNSEQSVVCTQGAKCQSTEQSVDRHRESSTERGAIRRRRDSRSVQGAIRQQRSDPEWARSIKFRARSNP